MLLMCRACVWFERMLLSSSSSATEKQRIFSTLMWNIAHILLLLKVRTVINQKKKKQEQWGSWRWSYSLYLYWICSSQPIIFFLVHWHNSLLCFLWCMFSVVYTTSQNSTVTICHPLICPTNWLFFMSVEAQFKRMFFGVIFLLLFLPPWVTNNFV